MSIQTHIKSRRSVRTFDGRELRQEDLEQLKDFMDTFKNPFGIPVGYKLANAKEQPLPCPVVVGTDLYLLGKVENIPNACVAFGYSIEAMMLKAQSLGIGTVWLGGTMDRAAFEKAAELAENEVMPRNWKNTREAYLRSVGMLCEICLKDGKQVPAEIVHHIIPIDEKTINDPKIALSWDNLQAVCREHHELIHRHEIPQMHPHSIELKPKPITPFRRYTIDEVTGEVKIIPDGSVSR